MRDILLVEHILKGAAIVACGMGDGPLTDKAEGAVDTCMVLVAEHGDHDLCRRRCTWCASFAALEATALHRPAGVYVLLGRLGGGFGPYLAGALAFFDQRLLPVVQVLARCSNHRRVDNLTALRQIAAVLQPCIEQPKQLVDRLGLDQLLAK